ncbi:DUF1127 domain-containing protein [Halomonas huangheensis]|uniref:DUF1127 domain-containing protein n=1 Tax=Halomonas huangheensis TaxID=1178482 RepID=UPI0007036C58|nr:hypothetical protein AR456_00405 [Halomonas huangheensis]
MLFPRSLRRYLSWRAWRRSHCYRRQWDHLMELDDHLLRDLGFNRQQLQAGWRVLELPQCDERTLPNRTRRCSTVA